MTISFVPKLIAVSIALLVCGNWMIAELIAFTNELFARIPALLSGG
jgi:flagellar biosynthetic protein FliQ